MKILLSLIISLLSLLIMIAVMLVFFGVSSEPDIPLEWTVTQEDIARAKKILHEGAKTKPDEIATIELTQQDLNLAANYLLNRYSKSAAKIEFKKNVIRFMVTMTLPKNSLGQYLNISFRLGIDNTSALPTLTKFKAGKLLLPSKLASFAINTVIKNTTLNDYFILATQPIKVLKIDQQKLSITYYSSKESLHHAQKFLTQDVNNPNLEAYQQLIAQIIANHDPAWRLSLAELLKPVFALALQNSTTETAIEENKIAIMAVNNYVNRKENKKFLSFYPANKTAVKLYPTFLYKRVDLAQHFIASAAITTSVNGQIAQVMGEEKELSDAKSGSGFSFIDLAADKAGARFGELITSTPQNARNIQKTLSEIKDYSDFMPDPRDLPEHMNEEEFKQRYQSIDSPAYKALSAEIDTRINAMPLYKKE